MFNLGGFMNQHRWQYWAFASLTTVCKRLRPPKGKRRVWYHSSHIGRPLPFAGHNKCCKTPQNGETQCLANIFQHENSGCRMGHQIIMQTLSTHGCPTISHGAALEDIVFMKASPQPRSNTLWLLSVWMGQRKSLLQESMKTGITERNNNPRLYS